MKKKCENCAKWYGTFERSYLFARSYSADCGKTDPNYSCNAFVEQQKETLRKPIKKVVLESPFKGNIGFNIDYAKKCVLDSLNRGESPIASHLLYTQKDILDDSVPAERELGINAGIAWLDVADIHAFYVDLGMSDGMKKALEGYRNPNCKIEFRNIY